MATNNQVGVGLSGSTGTGSFVGDTAPTLSGTVSIDNLDIAGHSITATDTGGNITLIADGTGNVDIFEPPASETSSIVVNGVDFNTAFRINDIGTTAPAQSIIHRHSTTLEPVLLYARANSDTTSHAAVTNGMALSSSYATGWTGAQYSIFGQIRISADSSGTISDTSAPGKIEFMVSPDAAIVPVAALSIANDGAMTAATSLSFSDNTLGLIGTTTNDDAGTGYVGEFVSSYVGVGSEVSLTTTTAANVTSISLTAGDWDVWGNVVFAISVSATFLGGWSSETSATAPNGALRNSLNDTGGLYADGFQIPYARYSLSGTTTIYLSAQANFVSGTAGAAGGIYARRAR